MGHELTQLHIRLFRAKARAQRTVAVLIAGVPGSGKTHLARQYVFTQRDCYTGGIFWVDAKSRESVYKCFWEIAQVAALMDRHEAEDPNYLESHTYVDAVRHWFQSRHNWLLIFDGIVFDGDSDINDFRKFLPWNKGCSIIYTSIDATMRKKQRLFEPYHLAMRPMKVEDACSLLFNDLGIRRPTSEQAARATELVKHYECLPLAIHAIGHRLNATGQPIEKYRVKRQLTDKKLAEPFLCIMNDLFRLNYREALNLINLLSFLNHHVPVGMLQFGKSAMAAENAGILSAAQPGEEPNLDTTLGTLIHYGLIERTSGADANSGSSSDEKPGTPKMTSRLIGFSMDGSQDGSFSFYSDNAVLDVVKIHSVVQGFCRDELKIRDEELRDTSDQCPGFYDSWLIVATRFLCKSYETAEEKMSRYGDCGLVRDFREYETHASRLAELFPRKLAMHPEVLREAREKLKQLIKSISSEIDRMSPGSSQESIRNQKSVFDQSSSSSDSPPESSAEEGAMSRELTWNWAKDGSPRAESPEGPGNVPQFRLELFPPHIFRQAGSESENGYETDSEAMDQSRISPARSRMSQSKERPKRSPASSSASLTAEEMEEGWSTVDYHQKRRSKGRNQQSRGRRGLPRLQGTKADTPSPKVSPVHGRGSSSRVPSDQSESSSTMVSAAQAALAAVRRISGSQPASENSSSLSLSRATSNKENVPTYASIAARRVLEARGAPARRPASISASEGPGSNPGPQIMSPVESLDSQSARVFASPLARELMTHEMETEPPLARSNYSDPGRQDTGPSLRAWGLHTAPSSQINSRRHSMQADVEPTRRDLSASTPTVLPFGISAQDLSASTSTLLPYAVHLVPYNQDITVAIPQGRASGATPFFPTAPKPVPVTHPSAIMPGSPPLSSPASDSRLLRAGEYPGSGTPSRRSSGFSHQSWATDPIRSPPHVSSASSVAQPGDIAGISNPLLQQQHILPNPGSWTSDHALASITSAIQSDRVSSAPPQPNPRLGSVDERLSALDLIWDPEMVPMPNLHHGGHRVEVRDARQRLQRVERLHTPPRHVMAYRLHHPNLSGPLVPGDGRVYVPAPARDTPGARTRSGSTPSRPHPNDLGAQFKNSLSD